MKRQKKKQEKLVLKMLPKEVVEKLNEGLSTAEEFESATLFFSSVVDFSEVTRKCTAMQVVNFLNRYVNHLVQNSTTRWRMAISQMIF